MSFPKAIEEQIIEHDKDSNLMVQYILRSIKQLERAGVDFIVLPCNTLHEILPILKKETKLPIIDLVEETTKLLNKDNPVGILASTRTISSHIYDSSHAKLIYPTEKEQEKISNIIIKIIRNNYDESDRLEISKIILNLKDRGAKKVILGCTDLANLVKKDDFLIDTQEVLISSIKKIMRS